MIFLDTHVVVWLYAADLARIPSRARTLLVDEDLLISPMVVLELEYLFETDRIKEHAEPILDYLTRKTGLRTDTTTFFDLVKVALNERWTRDPFDRMITAQARFLDLPLLSKDVSIRAHYPRTVWN